MFLRKKTGNSLSKGNNTKNSLLPVSKMRKIFSNPDFAQTDRQ